MRWSLGEPDPFRLHHRVLVAETVATVVRGGMDKKAATAFIRRRATENVSQEGRARFVEVVETELMSLQIDWTCVPARRSFAYALDLPERSTAHAARA